MIGWIPLISLLFTRSTDAQTVEAQLNANWEKPPFQLSLLETLATENQDLYLPVLSQIASFPIADQEDEDEELEPQAWATEEDLYTNIFGALSTKDKQLYDIALASKYYSPRIISHYKHYNETVLPQLESRLVKKCGGFTDSWVQFNDAIYCNPDDIFALMTDTKSNKDTLLPFDRVIGEYGPLLVLYANVKDDKFKDFASNLYDNARFGKSRLVIRYIPQFTDEREILTGYGVELSLKRADYLVIDERDSETVKHVFGDVQPRDKLDPASDKELASLLDTNVGKIDPIKKVNIKQLSGQAVALLQTFKDDDSQFEALKKLSQDFPKYVNFLGNKIDPEKAQELFDENELYGVRSESTGIFINGMRPTGEKVDIFNLYDAIKSELDHVEKLKELGLISSTAKDFITLFGSETLQTLRRNAISRYRLSEEDEHAIIYLNDIEKDEEYQYLGETPDDFYKKKLDLIPPVKLNIFTTIFAIHPTSFLDVKAILSLYFSSQKNGLPQRIGILPLVFDEDEEKLANNLYYYKATKGSKKVIEYLKELERPSIEIGSRTSEEYVSKVGAKDLREKFDIKDRAIMINGIFEDLDEKWAETYTRQTKKDVDSLRHLIYRINATSLEQVTEYFHIGSMNYRNQLTVPDDKSDIQYRNLGLDTLNELVEEFDNEIAEFKNYETIDDQEDKFELSTFTFFGNFASRSQIEQLSNALEFLKSTTGRVRLRIVHITDNLSFIGRLKQTRGSVEKANGLVSELLEQNQFDETLLLNPNIQHYLDSLQIDTTQFVLLDGRFVDLSKEILSSKSLQHLFCYEKTIRLNFIDYYLAAKASEIPQAPTSELENWVESLKSTISTTFFREVQEFGAVFNPRYNLQPLFDSDNEKDLNILLIVDPIRKISQKLIPLIESIKHLDFANVAFRLAPDSGIATIENTRLYRGKIQTTLKFNAAGEVDEDAFVKFEDIPEKSSFSLDLDAPQSWLTISKESMNDLDNILTSESGDIKAVYELKNFVLEGSVVDQASKYPPTGLKIQIDDGYDEAVVSGTLAHIQLKINPGVWKFSLKNDGRSNVLYDLVDTDEIPATFNLFDMKGSRFFLSVKKRMEYIAEKLADSKNQTALQPESHDEL